jgi:hypothetical protein
MVRKKLVKVKDEEGTYISKEDVLNSIHKYYSKTTEARLIINEVRYNFLGNCAESMKDPISESIEALISMTKTLCKVFSTRNKSAPGADNISYEILKILSDYTL